MIRLGIRTVGEKLVKLCFLPKDSALIKPEATFDKDVVQQLNAYFENPKQKFDIPTETKGTEFQQSVWRSLSTIPVGEHRTYLEVAQILKSAPRAVGNACRANPVPLIVPCHRVTSINGPGGYAGQTDGQLVEFKKWLLLNEQQGS